MYRSRSLLPVIINDQTYYRTKEACKIAGISKATLLRWFKNGIIPEATYKDRRGWRLFTEKDIERLRREATCLKTTETEPNE